MFNSMLIMDDDEFICYNLKKYFGAKGFDVRIAYTGKSGIELCQRTPMDMVLLDLKLPDMNGLDVLKAIKSDSPGTGVIIITAYGDVEIAVKAIQIKADNFVLKPIDLERLEAMVDKSLESYRTQAEVHYLKRKVSRLEGSTLLKMLRQPEEVYHAIRLLADNSSTNVMILGETGTGKGLVANTIHELSNRRNGQFVEINCAGLSSELLESELFGHEKGAFTDAKAFKRGLLEIANGGSVFLDEIGEMSLSVQAKLLKVIEKKNFRRLGGTTNIEVDVRIMAATNTDLERAVKENRFRKDLYFRLNVMPISLPPLRGRSEDILPLANIFLEDFKRLFVKDVSGISPEAEAMLLYYPWPGNVRELRNVIERAVLLCEDSVIKTIDLPDNLRRRKISPKLPTEENWLLETMERRHLERVLAACNNNRSKAAEILRIHRSTLIKKIKKYSLQS
ncbi:MAG: sigma-54-dependent Fis family transcriptional regulator [Deltaproteobacteria bacterium]|nr:MAG: sigma-54-dependent Fis family transcriptional regulator [Deltaproteobacteria bacterium]